MTPRHWAEPRGPVEQGWTARRAAGCVPQKGESRSTSLTAAVEITAAGWPLSNRTGPVSCISGGTQGSGVPRGERQPWVTVPVWALTQGDLDTDRSARETIGGVKTRVSPAVPGVPVCTVQKRPLVRGPVGSPVHSGARMVAIIFTGGQERLTVRGPCLEPDLGHLIGALEAFARTSPNLILDVSRASVMSWSVAEAVLRTCSRMEADGAPVSLRTRAGSAVERMLHAVRDDHRQARIISLAGHRI
jgi:hypothetical protein